MDDRPFGGLATGRGGGVPRRAALKGLAGAALALLPALAPRPAAALRSWCRTDPLLEIGGALADLAVLGPPSAAARVTGPTRVVVAVPKGVDARLVAKDPGFGKDWSFAFEDSGRLKATALGIDVRIDVYVPASDGAMRVRVEFAPVGAGLLAPASAEGTANRWIVLRARA